MTIFLILAPYAAFAMLMLVTSATVSLLSAALICLGVIALDFARGRNIQAGTPSQPHEACAPARPKNA